jgi:hypothetical protein
MTLPPCENGSQPLKRKTGTVEKWPPPLFEGSASLFEGCSYPEETPENPFLRAASPSHGEALSFLNDGRTIFEGCECHFQMTEDWFRRVGVSFLNDAGAFAESHTALSEELRFASKPASIVRESHQLLSYRLCSILQTEIRRTRSSHTIRRQSMPDCRAHPAMCRMRNPQETSM